MDKRKIVVVVNNRANYARIKTFMRSVIQSDQFELVVVAGASAVLDRFGNVAQLMKSEGFPPDIFIESVVEGNSTSAMVKTTGLSMLQLSNYFADISPDFVVTVADRYETLATAVAASYMNIPLVHTQGGEVSGSIDDRVRNAISALASIHFPATEMAKERLISMGADPSNVFFVGCPAIDLAYEAETNLPKNFFATRAGVGEALTTSLPYIAVVQHPVTTEFGEAEGQTRETLEAIVAVAKDGMQVAWLWPNIDAGSDDVSKTLRRFREQNTQLPIRFFKNFSPNDYLALIDNAQVLVGNSSSGIREAAFLGVPAVNIGSRQSGRERGPNVVDVDFHAGRIFRAIKSQLDHGRFPSSAIYGEGSAGQSMVRVLSGIGSS